jgi:hypothetical protein
MDCSRFLLSEPLRSLVLSRVHIDESISPDTKRAQISPRPLFDCVFGSVSKGDFSGLNID